MNTQLLTFQVPAPESIITDEVIIRTFWLTATELRASKHELKTRETKGLLNITQNFRKQRGKPFTQSHLDLASRVLTPTA